MKNFILVLSLLFLSVACSVTRRATPSETTRIETHVETIYSVDTVFIDRPQIIEKVKTPDSTSVLDNDFAHSEVSVSDGILSHSLEVKQLHEPVPVQTKTVYRDSLVYVDKVVTETVEVPAKLNWWQRLRLNIGTIGLIAALIALIYLCTKYIRKFFIH